MPELTTADMHTWRVTLSDGTSLTVRAAYPTCDDVLEGWTVLKDHRHKIVLMVRNDSVATIERQ